MSIKAMIFDADGVLIFPWRAAQHFEQAYGITRDMTRDFFNGIFNDCLVGKADLREVLPPFLPKWGWGGSVDDFIDIWHEVEDAVDHRIIKVIHTLRQSGLTCCLATNQEKHRAKYMLTRMGFSDIFDHTFFSVHLGYMKPDHAYYQYITNALKLKGHEILFWDDSPLFVEAARECGWQAEVYTSFEEFEARLASYFNDKCIDNWRGAIDNKNHRSG